MGEIVRFGVVVELTVFVLVELELTVVAGLTEIAIVELVVEGVLTLVSRKLTGLFVVLVLAVLTLVVLEFGVVRGGVTVGVEVVSRKLRGFLTDP